MSTMPSYPSGPATPPPPATRKKRRPFRGLFGGLLLGLGLGLMLMISGILPLSVVYLAGFTVIGLCVGLVLAFVSPARRPRPKSR